MACQKIFFKIQTWNVGEKLLPNPSLEKQD